MANVVTENQGQGKTFSLETQAKAKELRLIDDVLFKLIASRKEVCEEILRTLLGNSKLIVKQCIPQYRVVGTHRELVLDCLCDLGDGVLVNIEVQKGNSNNDIKRCRFHLSSITTTCTPAGTEFDNIPDVTVLYITEYDALKNNQSITICEMCQYNDKNNDYVPVNDGGVIIYANTCIDDGTDKSELLKLFLSRNSFNNNKFPNLSKAMKYYKDDVKGVSEVCAIIEEYGKDIKDKTEKENSIKIAKNLLQLGKLSIYDIAQSTSLTEDEVEELLSHS